MPTNDTCCTIAPYFKVHPGKMAAFKALCEQFMVKTDTEPGCLYYGFCFKGDEVHCREGYMDAEAMLKHSENVAALFEEAQAIADVTRLEVHGPERELAKLRGPLAGANAQFFTLEYGFRK